MKLNLRMITFVIESLNQAREEILLLLTRKISVVSQEAVQKRIAASVLWFQPADECFLVLVIFGYYHADVVRGNEIK